MSTPVSVLTLRAPAWQRRGSGFGKFLSLAAAMFGALLFASIGSVAVAQSVEVSGELDVIIKEDFDHGRFEHDYFLRGEDGQDGYQLEFKQTPLGHLRSGQRVKVRGQPQGRKFQVESLDEQGAATPLVAPLATGQVVDEHKTVVLMVDLTNAKASSRYTLAQIAGQMYANSLSVAGVYREASLDQVSFPADTDGNGQPDVFGPFAINYDNSTCDYYSWASAAETAAQAAGINLSLYKHRVFVLPRYSDLPACTWAGIANVGCGTFCRAWIAEGESGMVYAHELGHNLNMAHAGTDPENDSTINSAYGDLSDPMGLSRGWHVFNAGHIDQMGWYAGVPGAITPVTAGGTFNLAAIGNAPMVSSAPAALKIAKNDTSDFYYLSYRQPISYDSTLSSTYTGGVNIHRYQGTGYGYTSHITTLADGGTFTDSINGITVTQVSQGGGYATVEVSFGGSGGGCTSVAPTVAMSPATLTVRPGAAANFTIAVTNQDMTGCAGTTFSLNYSGAAGALSPASLTLAAGQSGSSALAANTNLADGRYSLTVSATDADGVAPSHSGSGQGSVTLIVDGTPPTVPANPSATLNTASSVRLSWSAAADAGSGVARYTVLRNGVALGDATANSYTDGGVQPGASYSYTITATDGVGNISGASNAATIGIPSSGGTVHVGDLDRAAMKQGTKNWLGQVSVLVENGGHASVTGTVVTGTWSGGFSGTASCTTDTSGRCMVVTGNIPNKKTSATFTVTSVTASGLSYASSANHDPDGDSNGSQITVNRP